MNESTNTFSETAEKQLLNANALLQSVLKNSNDYISAFDRNLNCIAWNRKCEEKTGMLGIDVLGKHALNIFKQQEGFNLQNDFKLALNGQTIHREEKFGEHSGFFEMLISPISGSDGLIVGVLCISHDLTIVKDVSDKLVELNYSLKHKNEQLEQSNNELASFSYVASHDLQEPLRKIQTFASRIMEKEYLNLSLQGKEYFNRMDLAAKRMQTLIDDLLTFSRTNTQPKNFKQVDLNRILDKVKSDIKETIEEKKAIIVSEALPVVNVISFQLHQLFENLLLNALKYHTPETSPRIKITCTKLSGSPAELMKGDYYKIDFEDNGIGFEQQYHKKIFELFQRLHGRSEYPGSGLGLAICKRIMQNHKGAITAAGEPGKGAIFTIYLPE